MKVLEQLIRLARLQELVLEIRAAQDTVEHAPRRLEEIEGRFRERNAEYVAVRERHEALETDQRLRSGELAVLEDHRKKYMGDLMQVQNQREYAAMLKEIDGVKSQILQHEEAVLKDMEEIETVRTELASHESHIHEERQIVERECLEVEAGETAARELIVVLERERGRIEDELPKDLVLTVRRLEVGRQGQFLSRADAGVCQSCFVRVRPQGFQEIKLAAKIHICSNCKRLLYFEPALRENLSQQAADSVGTDRSAIEAINGGAV